MLASATDIFVSYKAEDRARVMPLVQALEAEGFSVWWDARIGGGTNWRRDIEEHLDAAKCVLVAWTKRSVGPEGEFVRDEAAEAKRRGVYIPVTLDPVAPPLGFREIQANSLKGWRGDRSDPRFRAVAESVRSCISGERFVPSDVTSGQVRVSRRTAIAAGVGATAVAAAGGWLLFKPASADAKRIAVMPFANLSGDGNQAYFAEGIAEELRSALSRIGLQVIGRDSSEAVRNMDTKTAAAKLGVANILAGSVRRSPDMLRINAQLIDGTDGVERWSQSYDRTPGDEIKIQTDIATNVAQALSVTLGEAGKAALTVGGTADTAAQELFLRARELVDQDGNATTLNQAIQLLDAAVARDPNYADAIRLKAAYLYRLGSGFSHSSAEMAEKFAEGETTARRAIAIAPRLGSAYVALALNQAAQFQFASALQNMRKGLELSPDERAVLVRAAEFMLYFGDPRKALDLVKRQVALEPLRGGSYAQLAMVLFALRDYPQAIAVARKRLQIEPGGTSGHRLIASCFVLLNRPEEAESEFAKAPPDSFLTLTGQAILAARRHDLAAAEQKVARIRQIAGETASYQYGEIYAQAGDADRAFAELDNAVRIKDPGLFGLKIDQWLDPIRGDPRFARLLERLDFPYWG